MSLVRLHNSYKNDNISNIERFQYIENAIDQNFAGAGIAKFVAGQAWSLANKDKDVISIDGDGSFNMTNTELKTIMGLNLTKFSACIKRKFWPEKIPNNCSK